MPDKIFHNIHPSQFQALSVPVHVQDEFLMIQYLSHDTSAWQFVYSPQQQ